MRRAFLARAATTLLLSAFATLSLAQAPAKPGGVVKPVIVADVVAQPVTPRQTFVGVVKPARRTIIGTAVDGRVEKMLVDVGDWVQMPADGKPAELALLRTVTINIEIAGAQAELEFRQHEAAEWKSSRPEEVANASARMKAAEAIMGFAQEKAERDRKLYEQGRIVSEEDYRRSASVAVEAARLHEAAKASYEMTLEGPRIEKRNQMESRVKIQEQEIARLQDRLEKFTIKAPFSGYVVAKHTEVGAWVKSGDPIVEMVELDPAEIAVSVPEDSIVGVQPGMSALVSLTALPGTNRAGGALQGTVVGILPDADPRTRTYTVRVHVQNPRRKTAATAQPRVEAPSLLGGGGVGPEARRATDPALTLKAGMLARVDLQIGELIPSAYLVPKDAIVVTGTQRQLMVFRPEGNAADAKMGTIDIISVETGATAGPAIQVLSPAIQPGMLVVVEGNERLRKGETAEILQRRSTAELTAPAK